MNSSTSSPSRILGVAFPIFFVGPGVAFCIGCDAWQSAALEAFDAAVVWAWVQSPWLRGLSLLCWEGPSPPAVGEIAGSG